MEHDADILQRLRASGLLTRMKHSLERCDDADTVEELDEELVSLGRIVDAVSDLLLGLD